MSQRSFEVGPKIVDRPVDDLKPDPNQPRKSFPKEVIDNMARTIKEQGVIVPIEIDEEDTIVTGEIRWRGAKVAGLKYVPCILIKGITKEDRLTRQLIENLQHEDLTPKEREDAIYTLWKTGRYKTRKQLADAIGVHILTVGNIIDAGEVRERWKIPETIPKATITRTRGLPDKERKEILDKVKKGKVKGSEVEAHATLLKKAPKPLKESYHAGEIDVDQALPLVEKGIPEEKVDEVLEDLIKRKKERDEAREKEKLKMEETKEAVKEAAPEVFEVIEPQIVSKLAEVNELDRQAYERVQGVFDELRLLSASTITGIKSEELRNRSILLLKEIRATADRLLEELS